MVAQEGHHSVLGPQFEDEIHHLARLIASIDVIPQKNNGGFWS